MTPPRYVAALDQGTTSTRCMFFDHAGQPVARAQHEHTQHYPRPGWVEHDPLEIWARTQAVARAALAQANVPASALAALGVTNQRETSVIWERATGQPIYPALVWQDTRTAEICAALAQDGGQDRFRAQTGLPLATYFSGPKFRWILDHVPDARARAAQGDLLAGTLDTWLIWNLTGGPQGGVHVTDVTNASRTMLMNLATLDWDPALLAAFDVPRALLPTIRASSAYYGSVHSAVLPEFAGVPVAGALGDQQAALCGQTCFAPGEGKNTYGTGCFLLLNTGTHAVPSQHGLLTTVAYRFGDEPATYALEGSVAIAGALVQWLRDNLGLIANSAEIETLAAQAPDNGGVYFVPAFSGLFAPHWHSAARGLIIGLTGYANKHHIARAALEATAYQTREVLDAMTQDWAALAEPGTGPMLSALKVDGGMVYNDLLMQFQADLLATPVIRPAVAETTALGAAYAAGLATGFWASRDDLRANWQAAHTWTPTLDATTREALYANWRKAVARTFNWSA